MTSLRSSFPPSFTWGAAAAAYQIEGAWNAEGKGPSVWDMLTSQPGRIWMNDSGREACNHFHRYEDDILMMRDLGFKAYRLSISWPRVMPAGTGAVNKKGLDFYDRLVHRLLEAGIEPWVTLFHWDYPYELFLRGGWLNPESPRWFEEYARVVVDRLSDRVGHWMTLNEPQCFLGLGHLTGEHAPGLRLGLEEVLLASHHALLAHGRSVQVIRSQAVRKPFIGFAPVGCISHPATNSAADADAAMRSMAAVYPDNLWNNIWWGDPIFRGCYPEEGLRAYGKLAPKVRPGDMETINQPLDFYGCNIYSSTKVRAGEGGRIEVVAAGQGEAHTHFLWPVSPEALYWGPKFLAGRYGVPVVITENGLSLNDWVGIDGRVHDSARIDFLNLYLRQLDRAAAEGVDVRGYFHWSIMDNFEWAEGYKHRFGLVYVDYATQQRTPKDSAYWFRRVMQTNGASLYDEPDQSEPSFNNLPELQTSPL